MIFGHRRLNITFRYQFTYRFTSEHSDEALQRPLASIYQRSGPAALIGKKSPQKASIGEKSPPIVMAQ